MSVFSKDFPLTAWKMISYNWEKTPIVPSLTGLFEEAEVLGFQVGGEDVLAYGIQDLLAGPESAAVKFFGTGVDWAVIDGLEDIDQFFFYLAFKDVVAHWSRIGHADA